MKFIQVTQLILGIWIIVSPWILGYASFTPALWGSVVSGVLIALLSLWAMYGVDSNKNN
jgi:hypothetical protein